MIKPLSLEWFTSRKIRLTGSQWYNILVGGEHKQALLHGRACSDWGERCMRYGQKYEPAALRSVQTYINPSGLVIEQPCLYISKTHSFLAATPDGVIRNKHSQEIDTVVEVKCPTRLGSRSKGPSGSSRKTTARMSWSTAPDITTRSKPRCLSRGPNSACSQCTPTASPT